jgi:hypothetical protein
MWGMAQRRLFVSIESPYLSYNIVQGSSTGTSQIISLSFCTYVNHKVANTKKITTNQTK